MKRLISLMLAVCFSLMLLPAQAQTYTIQDMAAFSEGIAVYRQYYDKQTHKQYYYKVNADDMQMFIDSYVTMLMNDETLTYLGGTQHGEYVYQCFGPAEGHDISTFAVTYYSEKLTPDCCIAVQYKLDSSTVYLRCSKQLKLKDEGFRLSQVKAMPAPDPVVSSTGAPAAPSAPVATPKPVATATPKPEATPTPEPAATATPEPTATVVPTATPEPVSFATPAVSNAPNPPDMVGGSICEECEGKGLLMKNGISICPACNGSGRVS